MKTFHVFQVELNGKYRQVGPEAGFSDEGTACGYALAIAASLWNHRCLYEVVNGDAIVAVFPSAGTYAAIQMLEELGNECDEADVFERAA